MTITGRSQKRPSKWAGPLFIIAAYFAMVGILMIVGQVRDAALADTKAGMVFVLKPTGKESRKLMKQGEQGVYRCGEYLRIYGSVYRPYFNFAEGTVNFNRVSIGYCQEGFTMGEVK